MHKSNTLTFQVHENITENHQADKSKPRRSSVPSGPSPSSAPGEHNTIQTPQTAPVTSSGEFRYYPDKNDTNGLEDQTATENHGKNQWSPEEVIMFHILLIPGQKVSEEEKKWSLTSLDLSIKDLTKGGPTSGGESVKLKSMLDKLDRLIVDKRFVDEDFHDD